MTTGKTGAVAPGKTSWRRIALWTVLFQIAWYWRKIPLLFNEGALPDTDDFLRLSQIRDWMGGQGWYDLVQHRMDPPAGADIHWSRLVDLPIAGLIAFFDLFVDAATAERLAALLWPTLLLLAAVFVIMRICHALAGDFNPLLAVLFTVMCLTALTEFMPGRIDHHSVQILLFCLVLLGLASPDKWWGHGLVGAAMAASLSIGLDAILLIVLILAWLGLEWASLRDRAGRGLLRAAAGLAVAALLLYPLNIPPSQWLAVRCDANSVVYLCALLSIAAAFVVLALLSPLLDRSNAVRAIALRLSAGAVLAGAAAGLLYRLFPQCAAGPYGTLDEALAARWLVNVNEAMGLFAKLAETPELWFAGLAYSLLIVVIGAIVVRRHGRQRPAVIAVYAAFVLSFLAMFIQYRAMRIGVFAAIPLCVIFAGMAWQWLAARYPDSRMAPGAMQTALVALLLSPTWLLIGNAVFPEPAPAVASAVEGPDNAAKAGPGWKAATVYPFCNERRQYRRLAALPRGYVMNDINSGAPILVFTHHFAVGGPYHRNGKAILDMLDFFETDLEKPRRIARERGIRYVAWCDPGDLTGPEYDGSPALAVLLARGGAPAWLERLSDKDDRLQVLRVIGE